MILGIISALVCWIPLCNYWALVPAIVGLILGLVDIKQKQSKQLAHGMGIAGVSLNIVALAVIGIWTIYIGTEAHKIKNSTNEFNKVFNESQEQFKKDLKNSQEELQREIQKSLNK